MMFLISSMVYKYSLAVIYTFWHMYLYGFFLLLLWSIKDERTCLDITLDLQLCTLCMCAHSFTSSDYATIYFSIIEHGQAFAYEKFFGYEVRWQRKVSLLCCVITMLYCSV